MDPLLHVLSKPAADAAANPSTTISETGPPPAYTARPVHIADLEEDEDEDECEPSTNIIINVPTNIQGSSNLITLPPAEPARLAAIVLGALNTSLARVPRRGDVNVNINCGVTVVGDKNVVGVPAAGLWKARAAAGMSSRQSVSESGNEAVGRKRKADDESEESPEAKRVQTDTAAA